MTDYFIALDLVPYSEAPPETQAGFAAYLKEQGLSENPARWHCGACGEDFDGQDILITWNPQTYLPWCPTWVVPRQKRCGGHGAALTSAA